MSDVIKTHSCDGQAPVIAHAFKHPFKTALLALRGIRRRREMNYLLSLPDRQLKDIGLQRDEIQNAALRSIWS